MSVCGDCSFGASARPSSGDVLRLSVTSKPTAQDVVTSLKNWEMHPGQQSQRSAALSEVGRSTNEVLDDAAHITSEHNTLLWSTCRFASRQKRLSVVNQENASQDENEEALNEERFLCRDDITGAGESVGERKLLEGSKLKPSKMRRRRSKTVMEDLVFSIRPRMAPGRGLTAPPIGVPGCIGTASDALTYSATRFSCDVERPAEGITVVNPSPGTFSYPELNTDPFSASLPCSTENAIWLPPLAETYKRGTCADDSSRTVNATFPVEASAAQSHFLRREPTGTGCEIPGPCPHQYSKSGHREAPGRAGRRYSSTETVHIDRNAHDTNIRANGQLQHALLKTGGANENACTLSRQANSRKDSVLLSEVRGLKKDDDSFGFYLSNTQYQNLFDARRLLEMNKVQSLQRIAAWRESKTNVGAVTDVPERDIKGGKVIKELSSLSPLDAHMPCRIYGHYSPAATISRNSSCGYVLEAANSHHFNDRVMLTQVSNHFVGPPLRMDGKPADYQASLFAHNNAYFGRTSLTAMSHTAIYQASHSKQKATSRSTLQVRGETPHLPNVAAGLNRKTVHCELPRYRLEDGSLQSVVRQYELQAKQFSPQETGGVESITSCKPSHPRQPPHEPCHPARVGTTGVTRDSTSLMESVANRKDDTRYSTECLDDSLKSPVPAYSPVRISQGGETHRGNLHEEPTGDGMLRPVPRPRATISPNKEFKAEKKHLSQVGVPCPQELPTVWAEGQLADLRDYQVRSKSVIAGEGYVRQQTAQNIRRTANGVGRGFADIVEERSFAVQAARASSTNIQRAPFVQQNGDTEEANKISVYSMVLETNGDKNGLFGAPLAPITADAEMETARQQVFPTDDDCDESAAVKASGSEIVFRERIVSCPLATSKNEHSDIEVAEPVRHLELLDRNAVETSAGFVPRGEVPSLPQASPTFSGKSERFLYVEIVVAAVASLTCLVWIATAYPVRRPELMRMLHIQTRNATEPSFIAVTFETFWYPRGSKSTTATTRKPLQRSYMCTSDFCLQEAAYIKYAIREDVSPCGNFYQYVCSKWERETPLSAIGLGVSTSVDTAVDEYMSSSLRDYIMRKKNEAASSARFLYNVCMASHKYFSAFVRSKIFSALPIKTWPFNGTMPSIQVWRTAGIIARKYGVTGLLKVVAGTERSRNESVVELSLPNLLFFTGDELRPNVMRMFTQAIHEVSKEFNQTDMAANLTAQIMAIFKGLARVSEKAVSSSTCRVRKLKHIDYSVRTFISAVFNGDISPNTTVIVRSPDAVLGGLVRLTHTLDVQHFLNYLGFRLLVRLAALLPEHMVNMRRLFSVEFTGRVVRDDLKWLLCMRLAEAVAAPCLENVQANMFKEKMSLALARRFWLLQMEDFFSRNMRLYAWISEKSLSLMEMKIKRYKFVHVSFEKSSTSSSACKSLRDLLVSRRPLRKSLLVPLILATWETYQEMYLKQVIQDYFPRDPGLLYEANPRLVTSLHTIYVPPGLVNASVPENSTMLAFQLSRVATRLFRTLVPLVSVEDGQCSGPSAMTQQSQRSLKRLRTCLVKDAQSLPTQLQPRAADVLWDGEGQEGEEAGFAILAQTAALGLAFAAFKEMLRVDRIWRLDFRFVPLGNVSAEQLFFLYYALDNCERSDRTHRAHEYGTWRRLPAQQRVNLPLRQMTHFAEAFGCVSGRDAMAPADRCGVLRWPAPRPEIREDSQ